MGTLRNAKRTEPLSATVAGGYTLITGTTLLAAWWAYKRRTIRLADLRAWFACCELMAQRRASGAKSEFRPAESHVACMTAVDLPATAASLRRLAAAGLVTVGENGLSIPDEFAVELSPPRDPAQHALAQVRHHARRVPVPRRMLRVLATSTRPVFIATVLGHLLRCLFFRGGKVASSGLCKSSWIAEVFGVDERNVKAARRELVANGWLLVDHASQRFLNRWGLPVRVNLDWERVAVDAPSVMDGLCDGRVSPPPEGSQEVGSPPPLKNTHRFQRSKNHVPVPAGGACEPVIPECVRPFRDVRPPDLCSTAELRALFRGAVQAGLVRPCAADELRFFAAAERAITLGTANPGGFFATLVRRGLWHVISQRDEDAARRHLSPNVAGPHTRMHSKPCRADSVLPVLLHALRRGAGARAGSVGPDRGPSGDAGANCADGVCQISR